MNTGSGSTAQRHARLGGRDRHVDDALRDEVRVRRRLCDDLDRERAALQARRRGHGHLAVASMLTVQPGGTLAARLYVSARLVLTTDLERDWCVLVGRERRRVGRDRQHIRCVAVQADGVGAVAVGRDVDRPVVAGQCRPLARVERRCRRPRRCPDPGPRFNVPRLRSSTPTPRRSVMTLCRFRQAWPTGRDRVRSGGQGLAVECEPVRR